jgi:uncharacterized caspase-like protein
MTADWAAGQTTSDDPLKPPTVAHPVTESSAHQADAPGRRWALLVGVGSYQQANFADLPGAESDIEGLSRVLLENGFSAEHVIALTNRVGARDPRRLPTAGNIRRQLQRLAAELRDQDTIWIALAGHGLQASATEYYFCPNDAQPENLTSLISIQEIYQVLARCPTGFKFLLVDACRENVSTHPRGSSSRQGLQNIPEPPANTVAFFSCSPGQLAYERQDGKATHGVFFHAIIRGLQGAAAGVDGMVTLPDLERFVKKDVQAYVQKTYAAIQQPTMRNNTLGLSPLLETSVVERWVQQVVDLWDRQRREQAYEQLERVLVDRPQSAAAWAQKSRMLADDYEDLQQPSLLEQAEAWADRAVQLAPTRAAGLLSRANVRRIQGDYAAMLADCDQAVAAEPNHKLPYVYRAVAHRLLDQPQRMRNDVEHAATLPQFSPLAEALMAGCYFGLGEMETGFQILDQALLVAPDVPMLHFMKGYGQDQIGDHDQAILAYSAALRLDPHDVEVLLRRAVSLARVGDRPAAVADLQAAEKIRPQRPDLPEIRQFVQQARLGQAQRRPGPAAPTRAPDSTPTSRPPRGANPSMSVPQVIAN